VPGLDGFHLRRLFRSHLHAVEGGSFGDQRHGDNDGHVVLGLLGERVESLKFPEIRITGALDSLHHVHGAGIISGHHQIPVTKHVVQIAHMARCRASGFLRVTALVHPIVAV